MPPKAAGQGGDGRRGWFASLRADAAGAAKAWRATAGMGAASMLAAAALAVAAWPAVPPFPAWACWAGTVWILALLWMVWRNFREARWTGAFHYGARAAVSGLGIWMLWGWLAQASGVLEELSAYEVGPLLWGLLLWPAGRVLDEALEAAGNPPVALLQAREWLVHGQRALLTVGVAVVVTGILVEMRKDYPVDPTVPLAVMWPMALGAVVGFLARAAGRAGALSPRRHGPRTLDDPPPEDGGDGDKENRLRFGGDDW